MELPYDEGRIDSRRTSSGWNPAFNLYVYIYFFFCHTYVTSKMLLPPRASEQGNVIGLVSVYISESTVVLSM